MDATRAVRDWLATVQAQVLRGDIATAQATLTLALAEHPSDPDLRRALAGVQQQAGQLAESEATLHGLLDKAPGDSAAAFALARILKEQGRMAAAATVMRACFVDASNCQDADLAIAAIELLDDYERKADAAVIASAALVENPDDARLHAYAGTLQIQLGEFKRARTHYLFALKHDARAWEWHVPIGLSAAQRYRDDTHPDFTLFRSGLQHDGLPDLARAELHFALGKAHDDIGDYAQATQHFRQGNTLRHQLTRWSRKAWRRSTAARLTATPIVTRLPPTPGFTPVFIVGMPRSGTTLLAELLSRYPQVRNRGELPWLARIAQQPKLSGPPDQTALRRASCLYAAQSRRDDADDAHWFIDKQPLNFRYLDLALAMFPDARIVHCQRNARDVALSLWMQCFLEDVQGYSYDFNDTALVLRDCSKLMSHWQERYPDSIRTVRYEELVTAAQPTIATLAAWMGFTEVAHSTVTDVPFSSVISTASLWQARQPIHTRSVHRSTHYLPYLPELSRLPDA